MKRLFTMVSILITLVGIVAYFIWVNIPRSQTAAPSHQDFVQAITEKFPDLLHEEKPLIKVSNVSAFEDGWYIITISSLHEVTDKVPVNVICLDSNDTVRVILGPDTHFTEAEMLQYNLPDSVIREVAQYE